MSYDEIKDPKTESYGSDEQSEYMKIVDSGTRLAGEACKEAIRDFKELFR